jgi:hypothetical protein
LEFRRPKKWGNRGKIMFRTNIRKEKKKKRNLACKKRKKIGKNIRLLEF